MEAFFHTALASEPVTENGFENGSVSENGFENGVALLIRPGKGMASPQKVKPGSLLPVDYAEDDPSLEGKGRNAGIILHPTSLPGSHGIGDLGSGAYKFIDWLKSTGCTIWQVLPLVPPGRNGGEDGSPYSGQDANCGNTLLLSLDDLVIDGLLDKRDLPAPIPIGNVDYDAVAALKDPLISKAAMNLVRSQGSLKKELEEFRKRPEIASWLEEAALFAALSSVDKRNWWLWPEPLKNRNHASMEVARRTHKEFIDTFIAEQFLFQKQWQALHKYANNKGITIIGDMPIYVGGHSADVWANRDQFMLDDSGVAIEVSGVPPDLFSETGQLWGSPLYNWEAMSKDGYSWWVRRMQRAFEIYDVFRIDHFRGLAGYWSVPAGEKTALNGCWKAGPREEFFDALKKAVGKADIIAEDLGVITSDVVALRKAIGAPGMAILQFAFGDSDELPHDGQNPHLPHNHDADQVVYTGTHDNDTTLGWWQKAEEGDKKRAKMYLGIPEGSDPVWEFIRAALASVAKTAIIPMQDIMGLDSSSRMNTPAVQKGNWAWRVGDASIFDKLQNEATRFYNLLDAYNRLCPQFYAKRKAVRMARAKKAAG